MKPIRLPAARRTRPKWGNRETWVDGYRFDSKREAELYTSLCDAQRRGEITYFLRQVPIHLAPASDHKDTATTMRIDFLVFYPDGSHRYIDAKGKATPQWKDKAAMAERLLPIRIETW